MYPIFQYELFISYATKNADIAQYVVERIEKAGKRCFIAPRDIRTGADYATEIVKGISNSRAVLLIFSSESDKSAYVLREVNSAVSRNKTIIPLRIENFLPSEAMEFYLGPTHWLDAFPHILDTHLENIFSILNGLSTATSATTEERSVRYPGTQVVAVDELLEQGWTKEQVTMREFELDYLCVPPDRFEMTDLTEGTPDEWMNSVQETADVSCALMKDDEIIGYCDFYPVDSDSFDRLKNGSEMIKEHMTAIYAFGGTFDAYIAMVAIDPAHSSQKNYTLIFDWIVRRLKSWEENGIQIERIGISVYQPIVERFVKAFGFRPTVKNPAGGMVYVTDRATIYNNPIFKQRANETN